MRSNQDQAATAKIMLKREMRRFEITGRTQAERNACRLACFIAKISNKQKVRVMRAKDGSADSNDFTKGDEKMSEQERDELYTIYCANHAKSAAQTPWPSIEEFLSRPGNNDPMGWKV